MSFYELKVLVKRARDIYKYQGLRPLLARVYDRVASFVFQYAHYYIFEHTLIERDEADFLPRIDNFTLHIIRTNKEAGEFEAATGFELRRRLVDVEEKLEKGAIGFCGFVGEEFAHIGWIAFSEKARKTFDTVPYKVDFSNGQACTGGSYTVPAFRGKGLMAYVYFRRFQFLREMGIKTTRNSVLTSNTASLKVHAKFGPKLLARGRRLKLMGRQSWKETPIVPTGEPV
ncbi:MAG TPA: hypothetical protein G4O13_06915 [Dehalococcoidia bacterium]|nr:hypothetical protein [Dehalococcoidia bacterium]